MTTSRRSVRMPPPLRFSLAIPSPTSVTVTVDRKSSSLRASSQLARNAPEWKVRVCVLLDASPQFCDALQLRQCPLQFGIGLGRHLDCRLRHPEMGPRTWILRLRQAVEKRADAVQAAAVRQGSGMDLRKCSFRALSPLRVGTRVVRPPCARSVKHPSLARTSCAATPTVSPSPRRAYSLAPP